MVPGSKEISFPYDADELFFLKVEMLIQFFFLQIKFALIYRSGCIKINKQLKACTLYPCL